VVDWGGVREEESAHDLALYGPAAASARRGSANPRGVGAGGGGEGWRWWMGGQEMVEG
jgi:hypothetical protein